VIGTKGSIADGWNYDFAAQYSRVQLSRVYRNDFSVTRLNRALDVVSVGGVATCRSVVNGTDPNCVPWNIFTIGGVTDDALAYLQTPGIQTAWTTQQVVTLAVNGDLGTMGLQSPYADRAFQTAFGVEYRREGLSSDTDNAFSTGDLSGQGGPTIGLAGVTENYDIFAEVVLPLIEGKEMAELLSLELAYRFSDYGSGVNTDTYKVAGDWAPTSDIRFRASYQRAVRAPNVIELFTAQGLGHVRHRRRPLRRHGDLWRRRGDPGPVRGHRRAGGQLRLERPGQPRRSVPVPRRRQPEPVSGNG